jgi:hypothetical protein
MGTGGRIAVVVLALVAAGVLFFVLREGDESTDATTAATDTTIEEGSSGSATGSNGAGDKPEKPSKPKPDKPEVQTIEVRGAEPVGGVQELTFTNGDRIRFVVRSDVADEVHLHGYDVTKEVPAGGEAVFDVPATIEGVFEAELHHALVPIAEITVQPG